MILNDQKANTYYSPSFLSEYGELLIGTVGWGFSKQRIVMIKTVWKKMSNDNNNIQSPG